MKAVDLRCGLFASRATIEDALQYAYLIADATGDGPAVTTAIHVLLNTIADTLDREGLEAPDPDDMQWNTADCVVR